MPESEAQQKELAHYYSSWIWPDASIEWMKSLLLFFDGIATVLPDQHYREVVAAQPTLAQPLLNAGLLHNFDPGDWMTKEVAQEIRAATMWTIGTDRDFPRFHSTTIRAEMSLTASHFTAREEDMDEIIVNSPQRA